MNKTLHDIVREPMVPEGTLKTMKRDFATGKVMLLRFHTRSQRGLPSPISRKLCPLTLRKYISSHPLKAEEFDKEVA